MINILKTIMNSGIEDFNIVFFGTENFSLVSLEKLYKAGFSIKLIVTKPDSPKGRGQKISIPSVKQFAIDHNIPVSQPKKLSEIVNQVNNIANRVGVLVSFGKIIPRTVLDAFPTGIINLHPSLLPKYRGPSPVESVIENQEEYTGITIMKLVEQMDAGPIYFQEKINIPSLIKAPELYEILAKIGSDTLSNNLPSILSGELIPTEQDNSQATYCKLYTKSDGLLKTNLFSADKLAAQVRAHLIFPKSRLTVQGHDIIVLEAHPVTAQSSELDIMCHNKTILSIDKLRAPSGKIMLKQDFIRGYLKQSSR